MKSEWISVDDGMPEEAMYSVIVFNGRLVGVCQFYPSIGFKDDCQGQMSCGVTHWMTMPGKPENKIKKYIDCPGCDGSGRRENVIFGGTYQCVTCGGRGYIEE